MKVDLHLHTTASDGEWSPDALLQHAAQEGFTLLAITDHDSVGGIRAAQETGRRLGVTVIPGVELSCGAEKEIHILGYGFDPKDAGLRDFCDERYAQRETRAAEMVRRLCEGGMRISYDRVRELARGVVARPHVARALVEAGYANSVADAFERLIGNGRPYYVARPEVKVAEAVRVLKNAGGIAVLAHPMELKMGETALISLVQEWKAQGLAGIEVYHPSAQNNHAAFLLRLARAEGMLVTGGSDFHGEGVRKNRVGEGLERWAGVESDVDALLSRIHMTR